MISYTTYLAQIVGAISISIALYLTMYEDVPLWYSAVFFVIGSVMLLLNVRPFTGPRLAATARLAAIILVGAAELALLERVRHKYEILGFRVKRHG